MTDDTEFVDIAPNPDQILAELQRQGFGWEGAIGEVVDNALDAEATRVVLSLQKANRCVVIQDNGIGCQEPHRMLISGDTTKRGRRDVLGRYGVGLKHASYYLAGLDGTTSITTTHGGLHQQIRVRWKDVVDSGAWRIKAPVTLSDAEVVASLPERKGTRIEFRTPKGRGFLSRPQWEDMLRSLAFTFSPALRNGRQIQASLNGKPVTLSAPRDPSWTEQVDFTVSVGSRTAFVRAGIKADASSPEPYGLSYTFRHRVIIANSSRGCGRYNARGISGTVELDHHWVLGQNKSEVTDSAFAELERLVHDGLQPILEKAHGATRHVQSEALRGAASAALSKFEESYGKARRPGKHGSDREKKNDIARRVGKATVVSGPGSVKGRRRIGGGGVAVEIYRDDTDERGGYVDDDTGRIYLNEAIPMVAAAIADNDSRMFTLIAASHHIAWRAAKPQQRKFGEELPTYDQMMGRLLRELPTEHLAHQRREAARGQA